MVLVAPGIARFTVNGTFMGEAVANILDMQIDTTGGTTSRSEALDAVAGDILNNWDDHVLGSVTAAYVATDVSYVDLNTADGDTGSRASTSENIWPKAGARGDAPMPANVAGLVRKQVVGTRGRRSGRMYLAGIPEAWTSLAEPNTIGAAEIASVNADLASFLSGINDAEGPFVDVTRKLVVVHTQRPSPEADPVFNGYSDVESLVLQPLLATQRRRLR